MTAPDELVILIWAPWGRDAVLATQLLERNGFVARACSSAAEVAALSPTAGCAVMTEEALQGAARGLLSAAFAEQAPWSDFPVILFAPRQAGRVADALEAALVLGNVTILERPVQSRTLVSAAAAALRARRRQYEARSAIQKRDEFLAMLGHELRNPLSAMMLAVQILDRECGALGERPRTILARQARHLTRLVDDLLDVARVTTGKVTLVEEPIDLRQLLARVVQGVEATARQRETRIVLEVAPAPMIVRGDLVRLEEVFTNLLANAIKYSPEHSAIEVVSHIADDRAVTDVIDHGIGISPDMLPRVFDLFAQAEGNLARSQGGLGIGLTVVKTLVELHRGTVAVTSEGSGRGSRFRVVLPLIAGDAPSLAVDAELPAIEGKRVAVVEDNPDLLELTCEALVSAGCVVETAADGLAGLDLIRRHEFDLALVDIGLPGIDGYELARRIRADGNATRMVAMSGYGQASDREHALAAGFDLHLTKPVSVGSLLECLR